MIHRKKSLRKFFFMGGLNKGLTKNAQIPKHFISTGFFNRFSQKIEKKTWLTFCYHFQYTCTVYIIKKVSLNSEFLSKKTQKGARATTRSATT